MGTTLTGTTPQDTYDSLIKVTDNGPLTGSLKKLTDGLGNDSSLSLSTTAASLSGTLAVASDVKLGTATTGTPSANADDLVIDKGAAESGITIMSTAAATLRFGDAANTSIGSIEYDHSGDYMRFNTSGSEKVRITSAGNVGIGTSSPANTLFIGVPNATTGKGISIGTTAGIEFARFGVVSPTVDNTPLIGSISNNDFAIYTNNTEKARFLAGGGLTFNGDTAAANALDDYEEGTFTPTVVGSSTAGTATYSEQQGRYTKIGRLVQFEIFIVYSAGTGTGNLNISGLPFNIGGISYPSFTIGAFDQIILTADTYAMAWGNISTSTIRLAQMPTGGGTQSSIPYDAAGAMQISGTYSV